MSRQFWVFLSQTNSEWNKIDYNRNVAWQEDILTESNDLSTKDCNGKTKKQITRSVRRLQSLFQITVTIFTLDYVNINFPSHYNRQNNPKSYPSLTLDILSSLIYSWYFASVFTENNITCHVYTCNVRVVLYGYDFDLYLFIMHGVCSVAWQGGGSRDRMDCNCHQIFF